MEPGGACTRHTTSFPCPRNAIPSSCEYALGILDTNKLKAGSPRVHSGRAKSFHAFSRAVAESCGTADNISIFCFKATTMKYRVNQGGIKLLLTWNYLYICLRCKLEAGEKSAVFCRLTRTTGKEARTANSQVNNLFRICQVIQCNPTVLANHQLSD